jgi:phage N-6-adenine-methyltransferase
MIRAAHTMKNLSTIVDELPSTESQARPLSYLEPEQQIEAWETAVNTAPNGKVTAAHVQSIVDEMKDDEESDYEYMRQAAYSVQKVGNDVDIQELPSPVHVSHNSGNNEWYTPPEFIEAARVLMGDIDTDPASSEIANETIKATTYYTEETDGLAWDWNGRVWMNPPYAQPLITDFCEKLVIDYRQGFVTEACVLVNNATETRWFNSLLDESTAVCFVKGRIKFLDMQGNPSGAPLQGQAVLYFGENVTGFNNCFSPFGKVLYAR